MAQVLQLELPEEENWGASSDAISFHYDAGNSFFARWLDNSLTYSAARWCDNSGENCATLEEAQARKLDFHLEAVAADSDSHILDIGCGWGSLLDRAINDFGVSSATGLTLSREQYGYVQNRQLSGCDVFLESYEKFNPERLFSGIISIGAFEHFVKPGQSDSIRLEIYKNFFTRCRSYLVNGGRLSLQTITWGNVSDFQAQRWLPQDVFPESDVPRVHEIFQASQHVFEPIYFENRRSDYILTLEEWHRRLLRSARSPLAGISPAQLRYYDSYLRRAIAGFKRKRMYVTRLIFKAL